MLEIAEPIDGSYIARFRGLARELATCLCFGLAERIGDEVFNCAVFIDQTGQLCGRYHKTQLAEGAHPSWSFNRIGSRLRAFDTPLGRAGMLICNDRSNPRISRALALDGARLLLIPTAGSRKASQNRSVLARGRENGVAVVQANVGMAMLVSKGEMVGYQWGHDRILAGEVEVPVAPSAEAARRAEAEYLELQGPEMRCRYERTVEQRGMPAW